MLVIHLENDKIGNMSTSIMPRWAWITLFITTILSTALITFFLVSLSKEQMILPAKNELSNFQTERPVEATVEILPTFTASPTQTLTPTIMPSNTVATFTPTIVATNIEVTTPPTEQPTIVAESVDAEGCPPPEGWVAYTIQQGDTLFAFQLGANRAGNPTTVDEIMLANCIDTTFLQVDQVIFLPEGAAENAPPSEPVAPALPAGISRTANCPCTLTIQPGWRLEQIADEINRIPVAFSGADFLAVTGKGSTLPARSFLTSVPAGSGLEGFMLPGSYTLQNDTTAIALRDMILDAFEANAAPIINSAQGMTPYEAVILASIIQREAGDPNEQRLVSSVFHNRRATGRAFAATVTIQYALGHSGNWWPRLQQGQTSLDSPYNTYRYAGFPPTPISNPSISALQAAVNPAQTDYLYFTGNCRGSGNAYAATYEQHLANVECR